MSRPKTTTTRSVWHVYCPACDARVDTEGEDAGTYDGCEATFDCTACGTTIYTDTVTLVVAATTQETADARARRIRGAARE